jgi:hypothetical protein
MPLPGPAHCHTGLVQAAPGFVPTHHKVVSLQLLGHPATPITLLCLGMDRFHTGQQGYLVTIYARGCVSLNIGIKATAAYLKHLTEHRHGPRVMPLRHKGIPQHGPWTKKRMAFLSTSPH